MFLSKVFPPSFVFIDNKFNGAYNMGVESNKINVAF